MENIPCRKPLLHNLCSHSPTDTPILANFSLAIIPLPSLSKYSQHKGPGYRSSCFCIHFHLPTHLHNYFYSVSSLHSLNWRDVEERWARTLKPLLCSGRTETCPSLGQWGSSHGDLPMGQFLPHCFRQQKLLELSCLDNLVCRIAGS